MRTSVAASATPVVRTIAAPKPAPPSAAMLTLQAALARRLGAAGPQTGAMVYDLGAHQPLFTLRPDLKRAPASLEKIFTTVALASDLGPDARLQTSVLARGHLDGSGVWHGDLYLHGGGDPTFGDGTFNHVWEQGYGPTAGQLVGQLRGAGIRRVTGKVIGDASLFDDRRGGPADGFAPDVPDFGGQLSALTYDHGSTSGRLSPGAFAAKELVLTMRRGGIAATAAKSTAQAPTGARTLATVSSPPLSTLLRLMDVPSDDLFAEMLTKQLGVKLGSGGTTEAGAQVITEVINSYGLHPRIVDGSGLSRADQSSPAEVVDLLRATWHSPVGHLLSRSLPVVGVNGTVSSIGVKTAAQGHCIAKTGTLDGVTNLAGYCAAHGGRMLAFALFVDGPPNWKAIPMLSQMVAAIARY